MVSGIPGKMIHGKDRREHDLNLMQTAEFSTKKVLLWDIRGGL
jgi:hypothetical protein